jgi:hypothetical protein
MSIANRSRDLFRRFILPGFALKAVIIGGGYATGRELAEFFGPSGAWGGLLGMLLAAVVWSVAAAITFAFARATNSLDYRSFFQHLLGRFWFAYEIAFVLLLVIMLAVFGAAAGAVGHALMGLPEIVGTLALVMLIALFAAFGTGSVEALFEVVSFLLYGVYALFLVLAVTGFGDRIAAAFAPHVVGDGWVMGGLTYAGYNISGAISILPVLRHLRSRRDAVVAGLIAGPLAMLPAVVFFICMMAWPEALSSSLPSDVLLGHLGAPWLRWLYQIMIFAALLESGTGAVHAFNERIAATLKDGAARFSRGPRLALSLMILAAAVFLAERIGLVGLIASGYRFLAYAFWIVYVLPLFTVGVALLWRTRSSEVTPTH